MAVSELAKRAAESKPTERRVARDLVLAHSEEFQRAIGDEMKTAHFVRGVLTTLTATPDLQQASEQSLIASILFAAQLKLEIGNGLNQFHLTPREVNVKVGRDDRGKDIWDKQKVCVPMIGYQGYIELAYRHPKVLDFQVVRIREDDFFQYQYTTETGKQLKWAPILPIDLSRPYVGGIARTKLAGGGVAETYLTVGQIEERRPAYTKEQTGQGGKKYTPNTPWSASTSSYEAMCDKTLIREHQKWVPKSIEMQQAMALDGRVLREQQGEIEAALDYKEEFGEDPKEPEA